MRRSVGFGNLLVGGVWAAAATWLFPQWEGAAVLAGVCAVAQVVGGMALLAGRGDRLARQASGLALAGGAALLAIYAHAAWLVAQRFGAEAGQLGLQTLGVAAAALPWGVGFPLWQVLASGGARRAGAAVLLAAALAGGGSALAALPEQTWPAQPEIAQAAAAAWATWKGDPTPVPVGAGPALVLITLWAEGEPGRTVRGEGADLAAAVGAALAQLSPTTRGTALVLDVARAAYRPGAPLPVGAGGSLSKQGGQSPTTLWRPGRVKRQDFSLSTRVPTVDLKGTPAIFDSAVASAVGAQRLHGGWTPAPQITAETARQAALAGGHFLVRHQEADGRFAYTIAGPSGRELGGYNFPRHAGVTWFLARLAAVTGDADIAAARDRGLAYLVANTRTLPDGRAFVRDPSRSDRKVWVGTTALAVLAADVAGHPAAAAWGRFVASSVDEAGQVRGELDLDTGLFAPQDHNPYGQGQALLALASRARAKDQTIDAAFRRAAAYVEKGYAVGGAGRLVVLDEHWACLAALAAREAGVADAGWSLCRSYVAQAASSTPTPGSGLHLSTGAAGGLAEAVAAAAALDPDGPWRDRALRFGQLFLESAYKAGDAPFLAQPEALLGGFRDGAGDWDVRMDAVQHIGCALLSVEALLSTNKKGSWP